MTTMNISSAISDFKWVLRVLKSSKSKEHLDATLKCFNLWESKHISEKLSDSDEQSIKYLRYQFWCLFRNKNSRYEIERM
jgi:capsule polysaccharide export protein KpsE/RkpR